MDGHRIHIDEQPKAKKTSLDLFSYSQLNLRLSRRETIVFTILLLSASHTHLTLGL